MIFWPFRTGPSAGSSAFCGNPAGSAPGENAATEEGSFQRISALWDTGLLNLRFERGPQFGPLGLPESLSKRRFEPALTPRDLADAGGAVAVYISSANFTTLGPRKGSAPRLTDLGARRKVVNTYDRIRRWWEMGEYVERWKDVPSEVPAYLIGVTGPPARRWVWGAINLDSKGWGDSRESDGLYELPTVIAGEKVSVRDLDAGSLRGRLIAEGEVGGAGLWITVDGSSTRSGLSTSM
nr:hypothetical protein [Nocardia abscessus]